MPRRNRGRLEPQRRRLRPRRGQPEIVAQNEEQVQDNEPIPVPPVQQVGRRRPQRRRARIEVEPNEQEAGIQQEAVEQIAPPPPKQTKTTAVQAGNGNNNNITSDPLLMPYSNEIDLIISQQTKEKNWNFEYVDFAQLLRQNCQFYYTEHKQHISIENGTLVLNNKSPKGKTIDNIELWTEAFSNFAKILIQKHTNLASDLFSYMSIIRSAITDATFDRIYQYDKQFRLRVSQDHTKSWAQIDGFLWLQFIAKGAQGLVQPAHDTLVKPCFDYNFKGICHKLNCIYKHSCMKCSLMHPAVACIKFNRINGFQNFNRPRFYNPVNRSHLFNQNRPLLRPRLYSATSGPNH